MRFDFDDGNYPLSRVISGGQIGADIAGLRAARKAGLSTSGWVPLGFKTKLGPNPELASYGLIETELTTYPERTRRNVAASDATVRLAMDFSTAGERLTLKFCREHLVPVYDVKLALITNNHEKALAIENLVYFIRNNDIATLNVAGNGLASIEQLVEDILYETFLCVRANA